MKVRVHLRRCVRSGRLALVLAVAAATLSGVPLSVPSAAAADGACTPLPPGLATGYSIVAADGGVFSFGAAPFAGTLAGSTQPHGRVVGVAANPLGSGYSLVTDLGEVFGFGGFGTAAHQTPTRLPVSNVVGITATPSGNGAWLAAADGGVFTFGDAQFLGSLGGTKLNQPVVAMASTPTGRGYWLVAADGGIFSFGDARFHGSTGSLTLARPIVTMATTPSGAGYWLIAADGGVFSFGDARFFGSTGATKLARPIVAVTASPTGAGYWLLAADGGVFSFGDAVFFGSTGGMRLNAPIVGMTATPGPVICTSEVTGPPDLHASLTATSAELPADGTSTFTLTVQNRGGQPVYLGNVGFTVRDPARGPIWMHDSCALRPLVVGPFFPLAPGATVTFNAAYPGHRNDEYLCPSALPLPPGDHELVAGFFWCTSAHPGVYGDWHCDARMTGTSARLPIRITPPLVEIECRNSYEPLCGEFRWDPEPKNEPMTLTATPSSTEVRVGEEVTMRIVVDDPDSAEMVAMQSRNVDWADPPRMPGHDYRQCDQRFGPWDLPSPAPGHFEEVETHTYQTPGTYTVLVWANTGPPCRYRPDTYNPYASSARTVITIVVHPADEQA